MDYLWIILVVVAASLIKGITGFGFALISLPLLIRWYSPKELIPVLVMCNLFASTIIVMQKKERKLIGDKFRNLIIYGGIFTILGVAILNKISDNILIKILGIFFILMSLLSLLNVKYQIKGTTLAFKIAGSILGFLTGSISISGPPLALFLHSANVDNQEFREIFAWFSIVTAIVAIVGYAFYGMISMQTIKMTFLFLPILFAGSYVGKRLNQKMSLTFFKKITVFITLILSIFLLFK
jgi:uncharacterized protein